ncbi:uncharacterized protein LOC144921080 [Branchiostoma floridae x Branchiostoma belcheri]
MGCKLAMLLGLTGLLMMLMVNQADSMECCRAVDSNCKHVFSVFYTCELKCRDGTEPTPYCGYGPCNMWGCNCKGGCRTKTRSVEDPGEARSLLELLGGESAMSGRGFEGNNADRSERVAEEARDLLGLLRGERKNIYREENAKADDGELDTVNNADQDMKLSEQEALEVLKDLRNGDISDLPEDWFKNMDKNNDGYIDSEELAIAKDSPPAE